jgi:hypothetical protein
MTQSFFHAFIYMLLGQSLVFISVTFTNGKFLPSLMGGVYQAIPNVWVRIGICLATTYALANYCIPKGYAVSNASIAGAAFMIASCLIMVLTALLTENVRLNGHIVVGTLVMSAGAAYVVYGLNGGQ